MLEREDLAYVGSHLEFWEHLSGEEKTLLEQQTVKVFYEKDRNLYNSDNDCLGVLLVQKGGLRGYLLSEDGREVTLFRLSEGDVCVLSASCALNRVTFEVHMDTEYDTEAYLIRSSTVLWLRERNVYVENYLYKNIVSKFSDVMWAVEQILFMSLDKRLAVFLLDEMARTRSEVLYLTQEQVARYIGSAREVVSRTLKNFQAWGLIGQSRGIIRILDRKRLMELVA